MAARIKSSWDLKKSEPDPRCWICNSNGAERHNGRYVAWPVDNAKNAAPDIIRCTIPGGMLAAEDCYIAKIYVKYERESVLDYETMMNEQVDLSNKRNVRKIKRKISRVLQNLGVAYADRAGLIEASNEVATSAWVTQKDGKEAIHINPWCLVKMNMSKLVRLVKKEVVHRALFRNLQNLTNKDVLNFTLDVLSMRVIAQTPAGRLDKQTVRLCEQLFNPKLYKKFPLLALCDASLTSAQVKRRLPYEISEIWHMLYGPEKEGSNILPDLADIKPSTLYFKIKALFDKVFADAIKNGATNAGDNPEEGDSETNYPWNIEADNQTADGSVQNDTQASAEFDKKNAALNEGVRKSMIPKRYRNNKSWSNSASQFWNEQIVRKKDFVNDRLKEFAKKWRTEKILEDLEAQLEKITGKEDTEVKPYAEELTYDGMLMVSFGISQELGLFWNKEDSLQRNRKKVAAFFDLSPSMTSLFPYMIRVVESVEEQCDVVFSRNLPQEEGGGTTRGGYGFAGSVTVLTEDDMEAMKRGQLKAGSSTCFNAILDHVFNQIEEDNIDIVLCFTDGLSSLSEDRIEKFNETGRLFFPIYMTQYHGGDGDVHEVSSNLDNLNGDSFTLCLPPIG